ncbi:MAG: SRPBCC domain-containing protein [Fimbriimonadaceae bacterium]|nr:SRPBCC domain-containing protein [Fimbriimonadaceae bacterium]
MKVSNTPDHPVTDEACKAATGKSFAEWFLVLDEIGGLEKGRRDSTSHLYDTIGTKDAWWPTTIYVEYEAHHGVKKKDGLAEGYSICCTKNIAAPVQSVYALWTDLARFREVFGDDATQEVTEGGKLACGGGCRATFTRVRPDKDLRFTWEHPGCSAPMTVDVMFQENKGKCMMNVMTSRIQTRGEADGLRNAWGEALNRLKALAEAS